MSTTEFDTDLGRSFTKVMKQNPADFYKLPPETMIFSIYRLIYCSYDCQLSWNYLPRDKKYVRK